MTLNLVCIRPIIMSTPPILPCRPPILKPIATKRTPAKPPILQPMQPIKRGTSYTIKAKFKVEIERKMGTKRSQSRDEDDLISVTCTPECPEDEDDPITSFSDDEQPVRSFKPLKKKLKLVVVQSL